MIGRFSKQTQKLSKKKQEDSAVILSEDATSNIELRKLRLVFEQTPSAIFILDKDFRFEYVNPGYERLSGFSATELIGQPLTNIFNQSEFTEPREEILKSILSGQKWEGEMETYKKDNSTYWTTVVASPFRDETGNIEGYIIIQQDISDRKKVEMELSESEKLYRTLIENSMNAVALNQDEKFVMVNSSFCQMIGYTKEELFQISPTSIIAPQDFGRVMDIHRRRMQGEYESINYTASFIHKSGRKILADLSATTIQLNGRNASYVSMRDITEKSKIENALKDSEAKHKIFIQACGIRRGQVLGKNN